MELREVRRTTFRDTAGSSIAVTTAEVPPGMAYRVRVEHTPPGGIGAALSGADWFTHTDGSMWRRAEARHDQLAARLESIGWAGREEVRADPVKPPDDLGNLPAPAHVQPPAEED